jgi:hypothetical protein
LPKKNQDFTESSNQGQNLEEVQRAQVNYSANGSRDRGRTTSVAKLYPSPAA